MNPEIIQALAAGVAAGIVGAFGWLTTRLWQLYRHEIRDMKEASASTSAALSAHLERDEEIHRELTGAIGELRGFLATRRGEA